jgi:hypothetical protein
LGANDLAKWDEKSVLFSIRCCVLDAKHNFREPLQSEEVMIVAQSQTGMRHAYSSSRLYSRQHWRVNDDQKYASYRAGHHLSAGRLWSISRIVNATANVHDTAHRYQCSHT